MKKRSSSKPDPKPVPPAGSSERKAEARPGAGVSSAAMPESDQTEWQAQSGSNRSSALLAAVFVALFLLKIPTTAPSTDLDPSWSAVLGAAAKEGWQFGTDIVFTYGPAGFLTTPCFYGPSIATRLLFEVSFYFLIAAGVCLVAWRLPTRPRALLLGAFLLLPATMHVGADLPVEVGLMCWGLLCFVLAGRRTIVAAAALVALTVAAGLGKFSFLVAGGLTIAAVSADFILRGHRWTGIGVFAAFALAGLSGWALLGQSLSNLPAYISNQLTLSDGYVQAMGLESAPLLWTGGIITVSLCLALALALSLTARLPEARGLRSRRLVLFLWLTLLLYLSYKHGFVRANADLFAGYALVFALVLAVVPAGFRRFTRLTGVLTLLACLIALLMVNWKEPRYFNDRPGTLIRQLSFNVGSLVRPDEYRKGMSASLQKAREAAQLPEFRQYVGKATVDVFGQNQGYALFNDLNYTPRPVFQSYCAVSAPLMRLNERFYEGPAAPQFVLFNLSPIDGRFPPLEDSYVLRSLLFDYRPVLAEGPFLLMERQSPPPGPLRLVSLKTGVVKPGERIDMTGYGDAELWLEISPAPTVKGRLRTFFAKPADIALGVWTDASAGPSQKFRAPPSMLSAGFLASPLLLNTADLANLQLAGTGNRPSAYSVELEAWARPFWRDAIGYRLYRLETGPGELPP